GPKQPEAGAGWSVPASWLAGKWTTSAVLAAAGLATVFLLWGASPSTPAVNDPPAPPAPDDAVAAVVVRESLQEKNLRIFREEVEPQLLSALRQLGSWEPHTIELRAEGTEVIWVVEGTRPLFGTKPPRARARFCVLARDLYSELDLSGTGDWK